MIAIAASKDQERLTHEVFEEEVGWVPWQRPGFDFSASFVGQGVYFDCPIEVNGVKTPSKGWVDDVSTEYAIQFLNDNQDQPFSLVVGFKTCHGPFTPPPRTA